MKEFLTAIIIMITIMAGIVFADMVIKKIKGPISSEGSREAAWDAKALDPAHGASSERLALWSGKLSSTPIEPKRSPVFTASHVILSGPSISISGLSHASPTATAMLIGACKLGYLNDDNFRMIIKSYVSEEPGKQIKVTGCSAIAFKG